jgi:Ca-activated chloride channel family protein
MMDVNGYGEIEIPEETFGDVILPKYSRSSKDLHQVGFDLALRIPGAISMVGSPSHSVQMREEQGARRVTLAVDSDLPNRDLVLDVRIAQPEVAVLSGGGSFAMVVPSTRFGKPEAGPRKLAIVIDRSGSMSGEPMTQAKRAVEACLGALAQDDEFALVAFDDRVDTFRNSLAKASMDRRSEAKSFLAGVDARGGTELASGFAVGAKLAYGGDVLVITDGQVMGTDEILKKARELKVRIHCLGIGSASQDRFLSLLASSTGGVSRFVTPRERVDVAAVDLFASIGRPVASDVSINGGLFAIPPSPFVFGGTPWVVFGEAVPGSAISVKWSGGKFAESVDGSKESQDKSQTGMNDTIRLLDGARQITDFESRMAAGSAGEMDAPLVALSEKYGLASRAMALVCVVKREADAAGAPPVTQVVPVGMPQDTAYDAYFGGAVAACAAPPPPGGFAMHARIAPAPAHAARSGVSAPKSAGLLGRLLGGGPRKPEPQAKKTHSLQEPEILCELAAEVDARDYASAPAQAIERGLDETDRLMAIAASLLPDGGAPGKDADERALATACAVLAFASEGHTPDEGAFRAHVARMVSYLASVTGLTPEHGAIVREVVAFAGSGRTPKLSQPQLWTDVEAAIG